jgi:hypothetical protein
LEFPPEAGYKEKADFGCEPDEIAISLILKALLFFFRQFETDAAIPLRLRCTLFFTGVIHAFEVQ